MVFMHHIVSHGKLGKALNLLTFVGLLPFLFLVFFSKHVTL